MKSFIIFSFCVVSAMSEDCPWPLTYTDVCSKCIPTCDKPNPDCPLKLCEHECRCARRNYRLDGNGNCVHVKKCPSKNSTQCRKNEFYDKCGCAPIPTCDRPGFGGGCYMICARGCLCKEGYIRSDVAGKCIRANECPNHPICPKNMEFRCKRHCEPSCEHSCKLKDQKIRYGCKVPACYCKKGFVYRQFGDFRPGCMKRSQCREY